MNWTKPFLHTVLNIISLKLSVIKSTWTDYVKNWLKAFGQRHLINVFIGMHTNLLWCSHLLMSSSQTEDMSYDYLNELIEGQIPRKSPWLSQFILSSLRLNQEEREKNVVRNVVKFLRFFPMTHLRRTCQRLTISCRLLSWHTWNSRHHTTCQRIKMDQSGLLRRTITLLDFSWSQWCFQSHFCRIKKEQKMRRNVL